MEGKKGKEVAEKFHEELKTLDDEIIKANDKRVREGFLPYPYLLSEYVTNSASTWFVQMMYSADERGTSLKLEQLF